MTTIAPPSSGPSAQPSGDSSPPSTQVSWEGDKMFNIYIYDYCKKRGFPSTARELLKEADISPDSAPPIDARQGLLFEWWSVFWVLFTAKSSGTGTEDAIVYTQHQTQQLAQRQNQQRVQQPQQPMNRYVNGMQRTPGMAMPPNGQIPNGVGPVPIPTGAPGGMPFGMSGPGPQPNGIPGSSATPSASGGSLQPQGGFQPGLSGRPMAPQQRGPNGIGPFQSPTMAHSPQNTGGPPGQQHPQPPMGQLGPSPHMTPMHRGMLPPNGMQGMTGAGGVPGQQTPNSGFPQMGRPPSRSGAGTPGKNMMMQPSPSMSARQIPVSISQADMGRMENAINQDIHRFDPNVLMSLKNEAGVGDKDLPSLSLEEKQRILMAARRRGLNPAAGPSKPGLQPPNQQRNPQPPQPPQQQPTPQQHQQQQQQQQQQQRLNHNHNNKRNSTSPAEEHEILPRNESSPPERKRLRRSPPPMEQPPIGGPIPYPPVPQGGGPPQMPNGIMRGPMGGPPMNGFPHPPGMGMNMQMNQGMGGPQMGNTMSPGMAHPMTPQQMQHYQYRQNMHNMQKNMMPMGMPGSNAVSPSTSDPSFNGGGPQGSPFQGVPGQNSRLGPNKPMGMMPPPSPANGPPKDQGPPKDNKTGNAPNGHPEGSPRNPPPPNNGQSGQNGPNASHPGTNPTTPVPGSNPTMTAPSPSAILNPSSSIPPNTQPPSSVSDSMSANLFPNDFITSVASSLDEFDPTFDPSMFRGEGSDINFERDFGQWFNPDDVGGLDLK